MPKSIDNLTDAARVGYSGAVNPYLFSSANWFAYLVGAHARDLGAPEPRAVRMGRGYQVWSDDVLYRVILRSGGGYELARVR